jgi:type I restriction-modification system DNA methylase subunit
MSPLELQQSVSNSLKNLNSLDGLKKLFWSQLNYERVNKTLSRRGWTPRVDNELAEDPLLLASGGTDNAFQIIYARLKSEQLTRDRERLVVNSLLKDHPYALFVFSNQTQSRWNFINVKYDNTIEKRKLFRRITVGEGEQLRTATEQLSLLDLQLLNPDASPLEIQQRHDDAFDVEVVTNKFFAQYRQVFEKVENLIQGLETEPERKRLFTQKLFNRLMFIAFIQKKGWLKFNRRTDYLSALWEAYQQDNSNQNKNFYLTRLSHLFFSGLNNPDSRDIININGGHFLRGLIGTVPYLNGGLFEKDRDDCDSDNSKIIVPDECLDAIFNELFNCFNFTVTESTPLDVEVAVDPEMLGKVFEELVTGRHESGSYYTPKPIVSFMCREALKGYLGGYETLINEHNAGDISVTKARQILRRLAAIKIVDPACGSGAYLLGMLHELHALNRLLDTRAEQETARDDYHRKLAIIQNNLYGVDKDVFAVNIARLRLWLSLAVEFEGDRPLPLPNLDFKIESGDSLTAPSPENVGQLAIRDELIRQYRECKADYMKASVGDRKKTLKQQINNLKAEIATWTRSSNAVTGFDWGVEFAEVFAEGGFDIVVANPPYGSSVDDNVRELYFARRTEGAQSKDTYGLFMARGLQLLRSSGQLCYIVSDTWRTIESHKPLRKRLLENTAIAHMIDLPAWIFNATVNTCIFTATKSTPSEEHNLIAADLRSIKGNDWQSLTENLTAIAKRSIDLQPLNYARYTYPQSLIATYENLSFFIASPTLYKLMSDNSFSRMGSIADVKVGLQTGDNEYYLRKRIGVRGSYQILDESKLLTEQDIAQLTDEEKRNGIEPKKYGGRCFLPYDKGGESDTDEGWLPNYYVPTQYFIDWSINAVQRLKTATIADVKRHKGQINKIQPGDSTKIASRFQNSNYYFRQGLTASRVGMYSPTFRFTSDGPFDSGCSNLYSDTINPILLGGILSSTLIRYIFMQFVNHTVNSQVDDLKELPVLVMNTQEAEELENLVKQIIEKQKINSRYPYHLHEQKEINSLIYNFYGLSDEDIREVEIWYCRRYPKLAEAQGIVAEVRQKYADYLALCERDIEQPLATSSSTQNRDTDERVAALIGL